ncbi:MAG: integrase arm-type DNA-binding domain-containing protein [Gammaproteobacteria bacterium]|nr:integrase arm-type DNA-binding domain-containing protein [Gammaproteobacteria bacterium]
MKNYRAGQLDKLTKRGRYRVSDGLYLEVTRTGSKQWTQRITIDGKRCDLGLGGYPAVTMSEAKDKAARNRLSIQDGDDPLAARRKAKKKAAKRKAKKSSEVTFRDLAGAKLSLLEHSWKDPATQARKWLSPMEQYAFPTIGDLRAGEITIEDVRAVLLPIWTDRNATAKRLLSNMATVFAYGQVMGNCTINPADKRVLDVVLPKVRAAVNHRAAMPWKDVPAFIAGLDGDTAAKALKFTILNASRSDEVMGMTWDEVDGDTWIIPAQRMKTGVEHRVPLSPGAMAILADMPKERPLVFPSVRGRKMNHTALRRVLELRGLKGLATVHGFRSSFRDWCAETGKPRELAEAALAHVVGGVEGAYFRSDLFERRAVLMEQWAGYCTGQRGMVVKLREGAA